MARIATLVSNTSLLVFINESYRFKLINNPAVAVPDAGN